MHTELMPLPTFETLRVDLRADAPESSFARLTLNRPDKLNALSQLLLTELVEACSWLARRSDIKVVVVAGAGRAFSSGFDLGGFVNPTDEFRPRDAADLGRIAADALTDIPQLTIAALHGHCVGGGLVLAAACDLRVAASDTRFSIPEVDLGIPLAWGGLPRLAREIGPAFTKELVLTCRPFDAEEAQALRFVNRVVDASKLNETVDDLARSLAAKPGFALRTTKAQVNAFTEEMIGTRRNASDADAVVVALADAECRATSRRYLDQRMFDPRGASDL